MRDAQTLRTQFRVSDFVAWQRDRALELNPNFQRRPVWKPGAKSFLIDTILRGLPVPIIFLRDMHSDIKSLKPKRDVVDGQQRIRTLLSFIDPTLLDDFDPQRDSFTINKAHNEELGGRTFDELPVEYKQRILDYQFSVHSFAADTDDRDILQIFARMNATGVKLNEQELRNAEFFGEFKTVAYALATEQLNRWRDWKVFTLDQIARMNEVELSSEFILLIMSGILERKNATISSYYESFDSIFFESKEVSSRFRAVFDTIDALFPASVIQKSFSSRTLFYALFAAIYGMQYGILPPQTLSGRALLTHTKPKPIKAGMAEQFKQAALSVNDGSAPAEVLKSVRGGVNHTPQRRALIAHLAGDGNSPLPALQ